MQLFDGFARFYEPIYEKIKTLILNFDSTYEMWRLRQLKYQEWKESRQRQSEIYKKAE